MHLCQSILASGQVMIALGTVSGISLKMASNLLGCPANYECGTYCTLGQVMIALYRATKKKGPGNKETKQ